MRFLNSDPAMDGLNWYAYASGNPIRFSDPSGNIAVAGGFYFELDVVLQLHVDIQMSVSASGLNPLDWRVGSIGNVVPFTGVVTNLGVSGGLVGTVSPSATSVSQLSGWSFGAGGAVSPLGNEVPVEITANVWNMPKGPVAYSVGAGISGSLLPVSVSAAAGHTWASDSSFRELIPSAQKSAPSPSPVSHSVATQYQSSYSTRK
jgi:hypothetical protein